MGIASVNIYAGAIIVYIIAGMANMDKRGPRDKGCRAVTLNDSMWFFFFSDHTAERKNSFAFFVQLKKKVRNTEG